MYLQTLLTSLKKSNFSYVFSGSCADSCLITGISLDSRDVKPGHLFAAMPSVRLEAPSGSQFISQAISNGAIAILGAVDELSDLSLSDNISVIGVSCPLEALSKVAKTYYPDQPETLVAVTGTDGKSSVVQFTHQLWQVLGFKSKALGTLSSPIKGKSYTTPDALSLHKILNDFSDCGITHGALEASSHGLTQHRLDNVGLQAAAFTTFSQDHLDYHRTVQDYFQAKARLFEKILPPEGTAVLNADILEFKALLEASSQSQYITYGRKSKDIQLQELTATHEGQTITAQIFGYQAHVNLPLIGQYQAYNALCALGLLIATGAPIKDATDALASLQGVRGRLQFIGMTRSQASVYIDYAHTPEALKSVLSAVRPHCLGNLSVVFGCGGNRDKGKRPKMGAIANHLADKIIITDDNPRHEDPAVIRQMILHGCPNAVEISRRDKAISYGISGLEKGDILIIAGKGHETYQIFGDEMIPFDDGKIACKYLT